MSDYANMANRLQASLAALIQRHNPTRPAHTWMCDPGIQALGVAPRLTAGEVVPEWALKVYVDRKVARHVLTNPIPPVINVGFGAVPIDVEAIGKLRAQAGPARGGSRVYNNASPQLAQDAGTVTCVLQPRDHSDTRRYLLSAAHVLAPGGATIGDPVFVKDGSGRPQRIGKLRAWSTQHIAPGGEVTVDAAIDLGVLHLLDSTIADIGPLASATGTGAVFAGDRLRMRGATSGRLLDLRVKDTSFHIPRDLPGGRSRLAQHYTHAVACIIDNDSSQPGDSGAPVVTPSRHLAGVHFYGNDIPGTEYLTAYSPITLVLRHFATQWSLDLEIVSSGGAAPLPRPASTQPIAPSPPMRTPVVAVRTPHTAVTILAKTVWGEARGESEEGRVAVAHVVLNRVRARRERWGQTVEDVCLSKDQFSCWNVGDPHRYDL